MLWVVDLKKVFTSFAICFSAGVLLLGPSAFAKPYGRFGDSSQFPEVCGPTRDKLLMLGNGRGSYWKYWDTLLMGWYQDKESKGYSPSELKLAWEYRVDLSNYVKANCP